LPEPGAIQNQAQKASRTKQEILSADNADFRRLPKTEKTILTNTFLEIFWFI
jgi:hypothetical protein